MNSTAGEHLMKTEQEARQRRIALALLRMTLGVIILATWYDNLGKGLYTADGLTGFFNWLASPDGNGGSLDFFHGFLGATIAPVAGTFAAFQMVAEFIMGLGLLLGALTRLFAVSAMFFFLNLFLAYFGGQEWIWTYVLLFMVSFTVALGAAGRTWGIDAWLRQRASERRLAPLL
jgi:uncharacterized membrane protein YphA (DoxX/SURF4 family)